MPLAGLFLHVDWVSLVLPSPLLLIMVGNLFWFVLLLVDLMARH